MTTTWQDYQHEWDALRQYVDARPGKLGYGETKAPADVDTLRDEECPVCSNTDSWDGNTCMVCQYIAPPKPFRDPDLDLAKNLDLRKDVGDEAGDLPDQGLGDATSDDPTDDLGTPVDPDALDDNGDPLDPDAPVDPEALDENGDGVVDEEEAAQLDPSDPNYDPEAAAKHFDQGGEPFTQGPNAPTPEEPAEPGEELDEEEEPPEDRDAPENDLEAAQQVAEQAAETGQMPAAEGPNAEGPALMCPNCGFSANAAAPVSVNRSGETSAGDGMVDGDVCPNCQGGLLTTKAEIAATMTAPAQVKV